MTIYITFDYELFLSNATGTVQSCLISPTYKYLELAEKYGAKFVFFVDTTYLNAIRKRTHIPSLQNDYNEIVTQLNQLARQGHSIQLHLHPQWYYSDYDESEQSWIMDFAHYQLQDCPMQDVEQMIKDGCNLISLITGSTPTTYRAGGYSFPTNHQYVDLFAKYGVTTDSSAFMQKRTKSVFQNYDYSKIKTYDSYRFSVYPGIMDSEGRYIEYPISTMKLNPIKYLIGRYSMERKYSHLAKIYGDGKGVGVCLPKSAKMRIFVEKFVKPVYMAASLDCYNILYLDKIKKIIEKSKGDTMVIIGHPKSCSDLGLLYLDRFLKNLAAQDVICTI